MKDVEKKFEKLMYYAPQCLIEVTVDLSLCIKSVVVLVDLVCTPLYISFPRPTSHKAMWC